MLTGKLPFSGPIRPLAMNDRVAESSGPSAAWPIRRFRPSLQEILYRALERDPKNRYLDRSESFSMTSSIPTRSAWKTAPNFFIGKSANPQLARKIMFTTAALALIPVVILADYVADRPPALTAEFFRKPLTQFFTESLCVERLGFSCIPHFAIPSKRRSMA